MYAAIMRASSSDLTFSVPWWIACGVLVAFGLTCGLMLLASVVAFLFTSMTMGFQGGSQPWRDIKAMFLTFVLWGLPVGLSASATWHYANPMLGILAGLAALVLVWGVLSSFKHLQR